MKPPSDRRRVAAAALLAVITLAGAGMRARCAEDAGGWPFTLLSSRAPNSVQPPEAVRGEVEAWFSARTRGEFGQLVTVRHMKVFTRWYRDRHQGAKPPVEAFAAEYKRATLEVRRARAVWDEEWQKSNRRVAAYTPEPPEGDERAAKRRRPIEVAGQYLWAVKNDSESVLAVYDDGIEELLDDPSFAGALAHEVFHTFLYDEGYDKFHGQDHHDLMRPYEKRSR